MATYSFEEDEISFQKEEQELIISPDSANLALAIAAYEAKKAFAETFNSTFPSPPNIHDYIQEEIITETITYFITSITIVNLNTEHSFPQNEPEICVTFAANPTKMRLPPKYTDTSGNKVEYLEKKDFLSIFLLNNFAHISQPRKKITEKHCINVKRKGTFHCYHFVIKLITLFPDLIKNDELKTELMKIKENKPPQRPELPKRINIKAKHSIEKTLLSSRPIVAEANTNTDTTDVDANSPACSSLSEPCSDIDDEEIYEEKNEDQTGNILGNNEKPTVYGLFNSNRSSAHCTRQQPTKNENYQPSVASSSQQQTFPYAITFEERLKQLTLYEKLKYQTEGGMAFVKRQNSSKFSKKTSSEEGKTILLETINNTLIDYNLFWKEFNVKAWGSPAHHCSEDSNRKSYTTLKGLYDDATINNLDLNEIFNKINQFLRGHIGKWEPGILEKSDVAEISSPRYEKKHAPSIKHLLTWRLLTDVLGFAEYESKTLTLTTREIKQGLTYTLHFHKQLIKTPLQLFSQPSYHLNLIGLLTFIENQFKQQYDCTPTYSHFTSNAHFA